MTHAELADMVADTAELADMLAHALTIGSSRAVCASLLRTLAADLLLVRERFEALTQPQASSLALIRWPSPLRPQRARQALAQAEDPFAGCRISEARL